MPSTYTPIATQTLTTATSIISFTGIPATYTDLVLVTNARSTVASTNDLYYCFVNNSNTTDYSWARIIGDGSALTSARANSTNSWVITYTIPGANSTANSYGLDMFHFFNYTNTSIFKTILWRSTNITGNPLTGTLVGLRRNTDAINRIDVFAGTGNLAIGCSFTLYGIKAA